MCTHETCSARRALEGCFVFVQQSRLRLRIVNAYVGIEGELFSVIELYFTKTNLTTKYIYLHFISFFSLLADNLEASTFSFYLATLVCCYLLYLGHVPTAY